MYTNQTDGTDITTWNLPEGATARLGRGWMTGGMAFSPDGDALVVATTIGCWWYNLNTMELRAGWNSERGMLSDVTFSPDGQWIATGNWDGDVMVFDTQNLQCVAKIGIPQNPKGVMGTARSLRFSQDGEHLTLSHLIVRIDDGPISRDRTSRGRYYTVYNWKASIDTPIASFMAPPKLDSWNFRRDTFAPQTFSPDGSLLAYTSNAHTTSVMHVGTGEHIAEFSDDYTDGHWKGCYKLVFSPCGKYLAACDYGNKFHVWNVQNGTLEIPPTEYMGNRQISKSLLTYAADGTLWVAGLTSKEVTIWNGSKQETVDTFECRGASKGCFSNDGTQFAITNRHGELQLWTKDTPSTVKSLPAHLVRGVVEVRFSKDGQTLLSCHDPAGYRLWDIAERQVKQIFHSPFTNSVGVVSISRSRELLAVAEDKRIRVWNLISDTQFAEIIGRSTKVNMVFSPTEDYLATAVSRRDTIIVWHLASNTQIAELSQNPSSRVFRMGFSPTGEYFVSVYGDSFSIWDTSCWEKRHRVPLPEQRSKSWKLLFHPNDHHLITRILDGPTLVWNLKNGEQIGALDTTVCLDTSLYKATQQNIRRLHEQPETSQRLWTLKYSRCGTLIAGGIRHGKMGEIRFWDATTLESRMVIIPPIGCQKPQTLKFSPCGKYLAVGAAWQDGQERVSVRLWDVKTGENIHTFWGHPTDIWSIDFSPDGELLASRSYDGTILLWDVKAFIN